MIKLSENKTSLVNLHHLISALDEVRYLINQYSIDNPGPAYTHFEYVKPTMISVQFDRTIIVEALKKQEEKYINSLASLGIDATEE